MAKGRFTRAELAAYHGAHVDDFVPPNLRLLVVGINPGLILLSVPFLLALAYWVTR